MKLKRIIYYQKKIKKINEGNEMPVEALEYMGNKKIINCIDKNNYFKKN